MSLSKDTFERAKEKATDRLKGWIANINNEKEHGIPKLRREYKNTFKNIKWSSNRNNVTVDICDPSSEEMEIKVCLKI